MIAATIPVAFLTEQHVTMTHHFLECLMDEGLDRVSVYHNGGFFSFEGSKVLEWYAVDVIDANGWPFYRMWNEGIQYAQADVCLVLNNDIEWDPGALWRMCVLLEASPPDVAIVSPTGEPRHAFAIRPALAPTIDERYQTWYGDTELERLVDRAGLRRVAHDPGIRHPHIQTTTDHLPGVQKMREEDRALYESKWPL